jgi:microcystin degradation protein MlrC
MRFAIAGISHETNTYRREQTDASDFGQARGEQILRSRGNATDIGGFVTACESRGIEPVPILTVGAEPSGTIARAAYDGFKAEILEGIADARPLDGVLLGLHGAGVVDGIDDLEADLSEAVRDLIGEGTPLVGTFDLHGNVSQRMADALDGVFACHQYPHMDPHERSEEAVALIVRMLDESFRPTTFVESVPLLVPMTTTFVGAGQAMLAEMLEAESTPGVIDVSWFHGFPYADIDLVGTHVAVTTDGDQQLAESVAKRMGERLWESRESFRPRGLTPEEAIERALQSDAWPVVINETSDNPGCGGPGDGTHLLRAMIDAGLEDACFGYIVDAETARQAVEAGAGSTIDVVLGARYDDLHGTPIHAAAYVKAIHDGDLILQAMFRGARWRIGPIVRLVIGGVDVVVGSRRSQTFDTEPFLAVGIDVTRYRVVALKSSHHFRGGFQDLAAEIITADPPGLTTHRINGFERQNLKHAVWPLNAETEYIR